MSKTMTLEVLSSIKGAEASEAVDKLFSTIKQTRIDNNNSQALNKNAAVQINELREDIVIESSEEEKNIIKENFPKEKNGYLVVAKVID